MRLTSSASIFIRKLPLTLFLVQNLRSLPYSGGQLSSVHTLVDSIQKAGLNIHSLEDIGPRKALYIMSLSFRLIERQITRGRCASGTTAGTRTSKVTLGLRSRIVTQHWQKPILRFFDGNSPVSSYVLRKTGFSLSRRFMLIPHWYQTPRLFCVLRSWVCDALYIGSSFHADKRGQSWPSHSSVVWLTWLSKANLNI